MMDGDTTRYRVSGTTVECNYCGEWLVAFYCGSHENAQKCLLKCIERQKQFAAMTDQERMQSILR